MVSGVGQCIGISARDEPDFLEKLAAATRCRRACGDRGIWGIPYASSLHFYVEWTMKVSTALLVLTAMELECIPKTKWVSKRAMNTEMQE